MHGVVECSGAWQMLQNIKGVPDRCTTLCMTELIY